MVKQEVLHQVSLLAAKSTSYYSGNKWVRLKMDYTPKLLFQIGKMDDNPMDFGILGYTIFSLLSERDYSPMSQKILQVVMIAADFTSIAPIQ